MADCRDGLNEVVYYGDDALFIERLFIDDVRMPPEVKFSILQGRSHVLRYIPDRVRRYSYADMDGRFWRWRGDEMGLVSMENIIDGNYKN